MSSEDNRVAFASVKSGSSAKCMEMMVRLIKDDLKLMQDQIVSISIHDSKVHHGDLEAVVFYRTQSTVDNRIEIHRVFHLNHSESRAASAPSNICK